MDFYSIFKVSLIVAVVIFWSCSKEDKNRVIVTLTAGLLYFSINSLSLYIQDKYYALGLLICILEVYAVRLLLCCFGTQGGMKTYIKSIFCYYVVCCINSVIEYGFALILNREWIQTATYYDMLEANDTNISIVISIILAYILVRIRLFETMKYNMASKLVGVLLVFEFIMSMTMVLGNLLEKYNSIGYLAVCYYMFFMVAISVLYKRKKTSQETSYYSKVIEEEYSTYERMYQREQAIKNIRHNLANHLQIMQGLSQEGKDREQYNYKQELIADYNTYFEENKNISNEQKNPYRRKKLKHVLFGALLTFTIVMLLVAYYAYNETYVKLLSTITLIVVLSIFIYLILTIIIEEKYNNEMRRAINEGHESEENWNKVKDIIKKTISDENLETDRMDKLSALVKSNGEKHTKDEIVNVMLNSKLEKCKETNIETNWEINIPSLNFVSRVDNVEILSNLIDNAIEACERMESGQRYINIKTYFKANFWIVVIENSKQKTEKPIKNKFRTNKAGEHGLGLKIVKMITNKYDGTLKYEDNKGSFKVELMINVEA